MGKSLGSQGSRKKWPVMTSKALGFLLCCKVKDPLRKDSSGGKVFTRNLAAKFPCQSQMEHTIFYGSQDRDFLHLFERF